MTHEEWNAAQRMIEAHKYGSRGCPLPVLEVVDAGALRGFVPVNRSWTGFSEEVFLASTLALREIAVNLRDFAVFRYPIAPAFSRSGSGFHGRLISSILYVSSDIHHQMEVPTHYVPAASPLSLAASASILSWISFLSSGCSFIYFIIVSLNGYSFAFSSPYKSQSAPIPRFSSIFFA